MGGSVKVILKKNDILYKQTRWTNPMPGFVNHDKFLEKDETWWDQYINQETEYKSPDDDFSPDGYGLIVLDFDAKRIISKQGYCSFDAIHFSAIWIELEGCVAGSDPNDQDGYLPNVVKRMWDKGMLSPVYYQQTIKNWVIDNKLVGKSYNEVWKIFKKNDRRSRNLIPPIDPKYYEFKINHDKFGWEYVKFGDSATWGKVLELVQKHYALTDAEIKNWNEWIKEYDYDDEDE